MNPRDKDLTPSQRRVLDFIREYTAREGMPPTVREIGAGLGFSSPNAVVCHLSRLRQKGFLTHHPRRSRGIGVVGTVRTDRHRVPILGRIAAGRPILAEENLEGWLEADPFLVRGPVEDTFVLRVEGDSMSGDGILPGDYLFVRRQSVAAPGSIVVALLDDEATVKRYEPIPGGGARLVPSNPTYAPIEVRPDQGIRLELVGVVVGVYRRI